MTMKLNSTSNENAPRIALVGCGAIAEGCYLPALSRHPRIMDELTLVDHDLSRAQKLAEQFGAKNYVADFHEVLGKVDGAIVALPIHLHHPVSMEFLSHSIPVLCEKPLAETAEKAEEMVGQAKKSGVALATNYGQRLWPQIAKVKEVMENRSLGEPINIKYYVGEVFNWPTVSGFYFNSAISTRGVLRDRGAHVADQICWWLGGKPKVTKSLNDSFGGSDAVALVEFEHNQCRGEVHLSWLSSFPCRFVVEFEKGTIEGEIYYPQSVLVKNGSGHAKQVKLKSENYTELAYKIVDNFINVIRGDENPLAPGYDVLNSVGMIDECYRTAARFDEPWYEIAEVKNG